MIRTSTLSVMAICALLAFPVANAVAGCKGKGNMMTKRVDRVSEKLAFSDEQRAQFTQMMMELRQERRELLENKKSAFYDMLTAEQKGKISAEGEYNPFRESRRRHKAKRSS